MTRTPARVTQADVARAIRAAKQVFAVLKRGLILSLWRGSNRTNWRGRTVFKLCHSAAQEAIGAPS